MSLKGKDALIKRWVGILCGKNRVAVQQGEGRLYSKNSIEGYYNDLTGKVNKNTLLDSNGVPINIIEGGERVYFPISIFQYALGLWDLYLEMGDEDKKREFLMQCEYIVQIQQDDGSWDCFGPIGYKKLKVSSMGQGEAISVLLRAFKLTGDDKWTDAANKAIKFMIRPVENGGTLLKENGLYFFEEYADVDGVKRGVLNGWIFSLFGVYDFLKYREDEEIRYIFNESVKSLKEILDTYDMGYWSFYDRSGRVASPAYHELHISLLKVLSKITDESYFNEIAIKWGKYSDSRANRLRAISKKAIQKLKESPEGIIIK